MYLSIPLILTILTTPLTLTLAHPNPTTSPQPLSKRDHYGWIGSFTFPACIGNPWPAPRPELKFGLVSMPCAKFSPSVDYMGINFGSGVHEFSAVTFYSDGGCSDKIGKYTQPVV